MLAQLAPAWPTHVAIVASCAASAARALALAALLALSRGQGGWETEMLIL